MKKLKRLLVDAEAIKSLYSKKMFGFAIAGAAFAAMGQHAQGQIIIQDNFQSGSAYGTQLEGLAPSGAGAVNLPGGSYILDSYSHYGAKKYSNQTNPSNHPGLASHYAGFNSSNNAGELGSAVAITLGSDNTGTLQFSGTLGYAPGYNEGGPVNLAVAYAVVGLTSVTTGSGSYTGNRPLTGYTGLEAQASGSLQEYVNGTALGSSIAFVGAYNPSSLTTLSYDLNTATGAISNVSFGSSTAIYNFTTPGTFSSAYTVDAEVGGTGDMAQNNDAEAQFSTFSVSAVAATPEPSTDALLAGGAAVLGAYQYRRRRQGI